MQEALCADALLASSDPIATVRAVAMEQLAGEPVTRADMEHCLDLVWESAPPAVRSRLRALDELRWARTQDPRDEAGSQEALDVLWDWHEVRRLWVSDDHSRRQTRGAQRAVERLLRADPTAAELRRPGLVAATRKALATTRGNAITWLTSLPDEDESEALDWLADRLREPESVVRRHAAVHAEEHRITVAVPAIREQLRLEQDETAAETLGHALLELVDDTELEDVVRELWQSSLVWRRLGGQVAARAGVSTVLSLLELPAPDRDAVREVLGDILSREAHPWTADQVEALCRVAVTHAVDVDETVMGGRIVELAASQAEAAVRGAEAGAQHVEDLHAHEVAFLSELPRTALEQARGGPLEALVERLLFGRDQPGAPTPTPAPRVRRPRPSQIADPDRMPLGAALDGRHYRPDRGPVLRERWNVESLSSEQTDQLRHLVPTWWPEAGVAAALRRDGTEMHVEEAVLSVTLAGAAVRMPLSADQWLDVFSSAAVVFSSTVVGWLAAEYLSAYAPAAAEVLAAIDDEYALTRAIACLPELTDITAAVIADRLPAVTDSLRAAILAGRLADAGRSDLLAAALDRENDPDRSRVLVEQLANAGDVEAPVTSLARIIDQVHQAFDPGPNALSWHAAVRDERLIAPLGDLLEMLGDAPDNRPDSLDRRVRMALRATDSERALEAFDRLVDDPDRPWRAFQWYPRAELAGELATRRVVDRLPADPAGVVGLVMR